MGDINHNTSSTQNYYYGQIVTPFQTNNRLWDIPLGIIVSKTALWRWICISNMVLSLLLSLYLLVLVRAPQHRVWAVAMAQNGFVVNTGLLTQTYNITTYKGRAHVTQ